MPTRISPPTPTLPNPTDALTPLPPQLLARIALDFATTATLGPASLPAPGERSFERVNIGPHFDIWVIRWGAASATALHDHGGSAGAFVVVEGRLVEYTPNPAGSGRRLRRDFRALDTRPMAASHIHTVVNETQAPATSVHLYSPPLVAMQHYDESPGIGAPHPRFREIVHDGTLPLRDAIDH